MVEDGVVEDGVVEDGVVEDGVFGAGVVDAMADITAPGTDSQRSSSSATV